nr:hypothetical protein [Tanacetum cinerariifolium]
MQRLPIKKRFGKKESVSKQERKKDKHEPTLDDSTFDGLDADIDVDHGMDYMDTEEPVNEGRISEETEELKLTTDTKEIAQDKGSAPPTTTTSIFDDEDITMAQTLIKMKEEKAKEKGVSIKDIKDSSRPARSILTLKPLLTINLKDKGKGVLKEPEPAKKMTRSDLDTAQIAKDAEVARLEYEDELAELEREKEKRQREKEASKAAIAEIFKTAQRSAEIRSRPPTKSQLRNLMMTYLKNMGGYKHSQLKAKTFVKIQGLYERQKRVIDDFKPMDSDDAVDKEKVLEEPDSTKVEVKIFRSDGSSRWIKTFSEMVTRFDKMDLEELYNLVMQRFETTSPEGVDLVLWGDLRTMFEETADDDLWKNQEE